MYAFKQHKIKASDLNQKAPHCVICVILQAPEMIWQFRNRLTNNQINKKMEMAYNIVKTETHHVDQIFYQSENPIPNKIYWKLGTNRTIYEFQLSTKVPDTNSFESQLKYQTWRFH